MLNFGLRWGRQEEGFRKDWDGGFELEGDRRRVKGCCSDLANMLVSCGITWDMNLVSEARRR